MLEAAIALGLAFATAAIAYRKNRNPFGWFLFGLVLPVIGFIIAITVHRLDLRPGDWLIRIETFPEENGPQISGVIARYTGMYGVDELLAKLPVEIEVRAESIGDLKNQLDQLGCKIV